MLCEELRRDNITWYKDDSCKYRVEENQNNAIIWVNYKDRDIAKSILLRDFQKEMDENDIKLRLNTEWTGHFGFEIKKDDIFFFIGLIECFISIWNQENMNLGNNYIDWFE